MYLVTTTVVEASSSSPSLEAFVVLDLEDFADLAMVSFGVESFEVYNFLEVESRRGILPTSSTLAIVLSSPSLTRDARRRIRAA